MERKIRQQRADIRQMLTIDRTFDTEQLRALHQVGKVVTASLDLDSTLSSILDAAYVLTRVQLVGILLLDDPDYLVIRAARGDVAAAVGERIPAEAGIVGRALRERQPVLVNDMQVEETRARPDLDILSGLRTYLVVPLVWRSEALGALTVGAPRPSALNAVHTGLICELAEQASAAVAHARDYAREQSVREETERLYRSLEDRTRALEQAHQQLVQAEKLSAIGQLAHGIAHELNTPLGVIVSNLSVLGRYSDSLASIAQTASHTAERLRAPEPAGEIAEALETSLRAADLEYVLGDLPELLVESTASAERIASIVRSISIFARRDADQDSPVDLTDALESAVTLAWNELKHCGDVQRAFSDRPRVYGHTSELTQVFVHLLLNAAHAMDERGTISISTTCDHPDVVVTITDTGRGIQPEHLGRVFDPFFTTRPPGQGTGMGLAVCHGIIARHGGSISLASAPGQGTSVFVRLPLMAPTELAA